MASGPTSTPRVRVPAFLFAWHKFCRNLLLLLHIHTSLGWCIANANLNVRSSANSATVFTSALTPSKHTRPRIPLEQLELLLVTFYLKPQIFMIVDQTEIWDPRLQKAMGKVQMVCIRSSDGGLHQNILTKYTGSSSNTSINIENPTSQLQLVDSSMVHWKGRMRMVTTTMNTLELT